MKTLPAIELKVADRIEVDGKFRYTLTNATVVMFGTRAKILAETTTGCLLSFDPYETAFVQ